MASDGRFTLSSMIALVLLASTYLCNVARKAKQEEAVLRGQEVKDFAIFVV